MGNYLPKYKPGEAISLDITGTVTGGRIVTAAGVHAAADSITFVGIASRDAVDGDRITVYRGGVQRVVASAAISVGGGVECAADGKVAPHVSGTDAPERRVGKALEAATEDGDVISVVWTD